MITELQNKAWSVLPKEFKEEVKEIYDSGIKMMDIRPSASQIYANKLSTLEGIFGHHNLTSDAEGEEMLTVSRKEIQQLVAANDKLIKKHPGRDSIEAIQAKTVSTILNRLFGSKCLPDENSSNFERLEKNDEPKPFEQKYKQGDKVFNKLDCNVYEVICRTGFNHYALKDFMNDVHEDFLRPYTDSKEESRNLSQETANCDKHFDNILKRGFLKERRLNIATHMMQGLICKPLVPGIDPNPPAEYLAKTAFRLADALLAEAEEGGKS